MLQTTCECGRTMRANSEKDFIEQVLDHMKHNHPQRAQSMSDEDVLKLVDVAVPRNRASGER